MKNTHAFNSVAWHLENIKSMEASLSAKQERLMKLKKEVDAELLKVDSYKTRVRLIYKQI
jgi:hypothetical protein